MLEISPELVQALVNYLAQKPYVETAKLISALSQLKKGVIPEKPKE